MTRLLSIALLLLAGCSAPPEKVVPPIPKPAVAVVNPLANRWVQIGTNGDCQVLSNVVTSAIYDRCPVPPMTNVIVQWNGPCPSNGQFAVEHSNNLQIWTPLTNTTQTQFVSAVCSSQEFFRVGITPQ